MSKRHTNREHVVAYDCDDTLVMWGDYTKEVGDVFVDDPHGVEGSKILLKKHNRHIKLLKDHKSRGYFVTVWSAGGYAWAKAVVKALELEEYVDYIMSKPMAYVDDLECSEWLSNRIYIKDAPETAYPNFEDVGEDLDDKA